jgi:hypothetical protein
MKLGIDPQGEPALSMRGPDGTNLLNVGRP